MTIGQGIIRVVVVLVVTSFGSTRSQGIFRVVVVLVVVVAATIF